MALKTAEEYLSNHGQACEYGYNVDVIPVSKALEAMMLYANQKLDEAAQKATLKIERNGKQIFKGNYAFIADDGDNIEIEKQSILQLKDKV